MYGLVKDMPSIIGPVTPWVMLVVPGSISLSWLFLFLFVSFPFGLFSLRRCDLLWFQKPRLRSHTVLTAGVVRLAAAAAAAARLKRFTTAACFFFFFLVFPTWGGQVLGTVRAVEWSSHMYHWKIQQTGSIFVRIFRSPPPVVFGT